MWRKETFSFHCEAMLCHVKRESRGFFSAQICSSSVAFFYEAPFLCVQGHSIEEDCIVTRLGRGVRSLRCCISLFFYYIKLSVLLARARSLHVLLQPGLKGMRKTFSAISYWFAYSNTVTVEI